MPRPPKRLLDQLRGRRRRRHFSLRTEEASGQWSTRFVLFHNKRYPLEMGAPEIAAFLTHLAVDENPRIGKIRRHHLDESVVAWRCAVRSPLDQ